MKLSAILEPLVAAGVDSTTILATVRAWEAQQADALEHRRKLDAERQARKRERDAQSRDVTLRHSDRPLVRGRDARVEDKTSNTDIEPQEKKGAKRAMRLPSDWTLPVEWRQDALDAGLPENQIDLQAATMRDWSRSAPKGAKTDWRAAWRNWCRRAASEQPKGQGPPAKAPQMADVFKFIGTHGHEPEPADDSSSVRPAIPHLSAVGSGR